LSDHTSLHNDVDSVSLYNEVNQFYSELISRMATDQQSARIHFYTDVYKFGFLNAKMTGDFITDVRVLSIALYRKSKMHYEYKPGIQNTGYGRLFDFKTLASVYSSAKKNTNMTMKQRAAFAKFFLIVLEGIWTDRTLLRIIRAAE